MSRFGWPATPTVEVAGIIDLPLRNGAPLRRLGDAHVDQEPVGIPEPDAVVKRLLRGVDELRAVLLSLFFRLARSSGLVPKPTWCMCFFLPSTSTT